MSPSILHGYDIVCFSSIDWQFIWQGHQEIMSTLAAAGNRVLFVENTGVRAPAIRDLPRVQQRIHNWWRGTKGFRRERDIQWFDGFGDEVAIQNLSVNRVN